MAELRRETWDRVGAVSFYAMHAPLQNAAGVAFSQLQLNPQPVGLDRVERDAVSTDDLPPNPDRQRRKTGQNNSVGKGVARRPHIGHVISVEN